MADPVAGLREMARVTKAAGVVAACVWDNAGGRGPLSPLWRAAHDLDPGVSDESAAAGAREGHLAQLARDAGLALVQSSQLTIEVSFETFQEWWEPLTLGVGSGGAYVHGLEEPRRQALRERLERAGHWAVHYVCHSLVRESRGGRLGVGTRRRKRRRALTQAP